MQKYLLACFHIILFLACKGILGWPSWGRCHCKPQWESPKNPDPPQHAGGGTAPGTPRLPAGPPPGSLWQEPPRLGRRPAGRPWKRCQAGRRAAQSCGCHFMLMARPLFIPLEFITIALFAIGSFSVANASVGFLNCDLINNE